MRRRRLAFLFALALVLFACGSSEDSTDVANNDPTKTTASTATAHTTTAPTTACRRPRRSILRPRQPSPRSLTQVALHS